MTTDTIGIIITIVVVAVGATWRLAAIRTSDLKEIWKTREVDAERIRMLESAVIELKNQSKILSDTLEKVKDILDKHLQHR